MFLALREMHRGKVRFGLLIAAIALLVFLILFQQSLQNGLLTSFVGGIRNQSAPVLVYGVDSQRVIQGSVITPDLEQRVRALPEAAEIGRIAQGTFTVRTGAAANERAPRADSPGATSTTDASILGYEIEGLGSPATLSAGRLPAGPGEGVASEADERDGFGIGDLIVVAPGGYEIEIVGLARDVQLNAGPTVFVTFETYAATLAAANPDAAAPLPNVLAARPADGVSDAELVAAVNAISLDLDALTRSDAADLTPGVAQVRQSFQIIFALYGIVVPCVTGLFFLIVTFQKSRALTLLRALGAPPGRLVRSLLFQALLIVGGGYALGTLLYLPVSQLRIGGITLRFETTAVIGWAIALVALGLGSSLFAARRVLRIDPVDATTGAGLGT